MQISSQTFLILATLFFSTFIRAAFGFGDALIAMPILAMALGVKIATPLVGLVAATITLPILLTDWRSIHVAGTWRLTLSSLVGIPFGVLLIKANCDAILELALAVMMVAFSSYSLAKPESLRLRGDGSSYLFGLVAGVFGGACNTNGPPVVIYGSLRHWRPDVFRATLQGYFFLTGLMILFGQYSAGLWTRGVLGLYAVSLPAVVLGLVAGDRVNRLIPAGKFERLVHALLIAIGLSLLYHVARGWLSLKPGI